MKTDWANSSRYALENQELIKTSNQNDVVFFGDSITEGWKVHDPDFFNENNYINRGIGGQTTSHLLVRFRPDVIALQPKVVVLLGGINDIAQNNGPIALKDVLGNIISMVQLAKANHIQPILCSLLPAKDFPWRKGLEPETKIIELNTMISDYCTENSLLFIDYYTVMADDQKRLDPRYTKDGVHPTLPGYKVMGPLALKAIHAILQQ